MSTKRRGATPKAPLGSTADGPLEVRRRPVQQRAQATVDRILACTAELLEGRSTDDVNTDVIAQKAGVNVATVYKYFPNKHAIYVELFRRQSDERRSALLTLLEAIDAERDWRAALERAIDDVTRIRASQPGNLTLRLAMRASPQLRAVDEAYRERHGRELAERFARVGNVDRSRARIAGRLAFEATAALLDYWDGTSRSAPVRHEVRRALESFLAPYLDRRSQGVRSRIRP